MNDTSTRLDQTFHALADPNRRAILSVVRGRRCAVGEVAEAVGMSQQVASHHLKVLRSAGLVEGTRAGTRHLFAVDTAGFEAGRAFFQDFWPDRLTALKRAVEASAEVDDG